MSRVWIIFCGISLCGVWGTGCSVGTPAVPGSGVSATESRDLPNFTELEIEIPAQLEVTRGEQATMSLTTDDNLLSRVTSTVQNGRLRISTSENVQFRVPVKIAITVPVLTAVSAAGSLTGMIEELSGKAQISTAGSSDLQAGVEATSLDVSVAGSGNLVLSGSCSSLKLSIAGSGTVRAEQLQTPTADVSIAGSGQVFVNASDSLEISIAGSGDVHYAGDPKIDQSIMGSGKVQSLP